MPLFIPLPPPIDGVATSNLLQTLSICTGADQTTTSDAFVDLLSLPVTTSASTKLLVWVTFTLSFSVYVTRPIKLRLTIDGVEMLRAGGEEFTTAESGAMVYLATGLAAGAHAVTLQWAINTAGDGTLRCRPSVPPENACITAMEVSV